MIAVIVGSALAGMVLLVGAFELGLKLGWYARDQRARMQIDTIRAEFQERRGARIDTRA